MRPGDAQWGHFSAKSLAISTNGSIRSESAGHASGAVRNVCCDMSSPREMSFELSAAPPPKPAILRELIARDIRECARYGRRIDGETAKLEIQADRANVEGRRDLIVDDVVDLKLAVVDVAQHQVGRACCV